MKFHWKHDGYTREYRALIHLVGIVHHGRRPSSVELDFLDMRTICENPEYIKEIRHTLLPNRDESYPK